MAQREPWPDAADNRPLLSVRDISKRFRIRKPRPVQQRQDSATCWRWTT